MFKSALGLRSVKGPTQLARSQKKKKKKKGDEIKIK